MRLIRKWLKNHVQKKLEKAYLTIHKMSRSTTSDYDVVADDIASIFKSME